jgi:hypothetical protein
VWIDYEQRIPAPLVRGQVDVRSELERRPTDFNLVERVRARNAAIARETLAISESFGEAEPRKGPVPA